MANRCIIFFLFVIKLFTFPLYSQSENVSDLSSTETDSLIHQLAPLARQLDSLTISNKMSAQRLTAGDSARLIKKEKAITLALDTVIHLPEAEFKPIPSKALLYSVIFPGLGQAYNRKYWKLPLVYGGFVGIAYAITWNGGMYSDYMQAYKELLTGEGDSWKNFPNINPNMSRDEQRAIAPRFKSKKDFFRRNRDLAIICAFGFYGLCILDAYVDAQLYDFDISPDLTMRVEPIIFEPTSYSGRTLGLQCSIYF